MPRTKFVILAVLLALLACWGGSPVPGANAQNAEQVIKITAKQYEFSPDAITVKKGVPVVLEFTSPDKLHGFFCPALKIRSDIPPGKTTSLRFVPDKAGTFPFHCDNFCGLGHEKMTGTLTVTE